MSYIKIDTAIQCKPKFRAIMRRTGLSAAQLIGHLAMIWFAVDSLGQDFEGPDDLIAEAVSCDSALLCALCAEGWADRFQGGITFRSNDVSARDRTEAHRARAARSYERRKMDSAPLCAQTAQSAPPLPSPPLPLIPTNQPTRRSAPAPGSVVAGGGGSAARGNAASPLGGGAPKLSAACEKALADLIAERGEAEGKRVFWISLNGRLKTARRDLVKLGIDGDALQRAVNATLAWPWGEWSSRFEKLMKDASGAKSPSGIVLHRLGITARRKGAA